MNILRKNRKRVNKLNIKRYILLIFSLIMTTFAWFTFSKILNSGMIIHIDSWNLDFYIDEDGDGELEVTEKKENPIEVSVSDLYPGMEEKVTHVVIKNTGETDSGMRHFTDNLKVVVLGNEYDVLDIAPEEGVFDYILTPFPELLNPEAGETDVKIYQEKIINDPERFPFTIVIEYTDRVKAGEEGYLKIKVNWPAYATYEDGDDEETKAEKDAIKDALDAKWGFEAGDYAKTSSGDGAISLELYINAIGKERETESADS